MIRSYPMPTLAALALAITAATGAVAQPVPRASAIGDSLTDEYAEQTYGDVAKSWTQILQQTGRVDFGPTAAEAGVGYWGEPRRSGYRDNWARHAHTTMYAIQAGQHLGAAGSVVNNGANHVFVYIGGNDFNRWLSQDIYLAIYTQTWTEQQGFDYADQVADRIRTIVDALDGTGAKIVLAPPIDFNCMGFNRNGVPNAAGRERVTAVVAHCRDRLRALAAEKHAVFLDMFHLNMDLFGGNFDFRTQVLVGNVPIQMQEAGDTGAYGFIFDGVHPQRVVQSIWAQAFLSALNAGFGTGIPDISEQEMLEIGGLTYGGSDTLNQVLRPMRNYIQSFACPADFDLDGRINVQDLFDFLDAYFVSDPKADLDGQGQVSLQDALLFVDAFFGGCP